MENKEQNNNGNNFEETIRRLLRVKPEEVKDLEKKDRTNRNKGD